MASIAMDVAAPVELRGRMFAELAQYVAPKRRAVEHEVANSQIAGFVILGQREAASVDEWRGEHAPDARKVPAA